MTVRSLALEDHFQHPRNVGSIPAGAPGLVQGRVGSHGEGVLIELGLRLEGPRVAEARFKAFACGHTIACCSWVSEWVVGKSVREAEALDAATLVVALALPADKVRSADWAVRAVAAALRDATPDGVK